MDLREVPHEPFERHPWERSRFRFFHRLLVEDGQLDRPGRLLDVGSGDAWFASELSTRIAADADITCWDAAYDDPGARHIAGQVAPSVSLRAERPTGVFDLALLLDVLEHIEDDLGFLSTLVADNLATGATALISVPAWPQLMTSHDHGLNHYRRYTPEQLGRLVRAAGLSAVKEGSLFHSLLLPRALSAVRERLRPAPPRAVGPLRWNHHPLFTRLVDGALFIDNAVSRWAAARRVPIHGLSVWVLCRK